MTSRDDGLVWRASPRGGGGSSSGDEKAAKESRSSAAKRERKGSLGEESSRRRTRREEQQERLRNRGRSRSVSSRSHHHRSRSRSKSENNNNNNRRSSHHRRENKNRKSSRRRPSSNNSLSSSSPAPGERRRTKRWMRAARSPPSRRSRSPRSCSSPRRGEGGVRGSRSSPLSSRRSRRENSINKNKNDDGEDAYRQRSRRKRRHQRSRSRSNHHKQRSSMSPSPDPRDRRGGGRSRRQRRRRRPPRRRRRDASNSSNSQPPRPPPVDVPPRAGVVSEDDDGHLVGDNGGGGDAADNATTPSKAAPTGQTTTTTTSNKKKRKSPSSSHDDTTGHFKGKEGTLIADRYRILREVGVGTFGRVVECLDLKRARSSGGSISRRDRSNNTDGGGKNNSHKIVAIKIVRNVKRYYDSALIEADIVEDVNRRGGRGVSHCALMFDAFSFQGHYCMVFEKLGPSLYDFLKRQKYQPFPMTCVRDFAKQLLETLEFLHSFRLIHTDLKPENILLLNGREVSYKGCMIPECTRIKVIDFGGATYDNERKSSVVNTRQYRAPEVILGVGWSMPSDLWSVGCILAELYQGELLFATHDNIEHLALIEQVVGPFPRRMLKRAKNTQLANQAFDSTGAHRMERVLPSESLAYVKRIGPLESIVYEEDKWFLRLLRRILVTDPDERATARECKRASFEMKHVT